VRFRRPIRHLSVAGRRAFAGAAAVAILTIVVIAGERPGVARAGWAAPTLKEQRSGTTELLQAISVVDETTVWVSGHGGTWVRTTDGGHTWHSAVMAGEEDLQFRDVHAVDARTAFLLSAGTGEQSRIYKTIDGGNTWVLQFRNEEPAGFYDCLDFWDADHGVAYGDAVAGELRILTTRDAGETWERADAETLPAALPAEGGFAASGTCAVVLPGGHGWIATGNGTRPRLLATSDGGESWRVEELPLPGGEGAGAFSVAFRDPRNGVAFGGDLRAPEARLEVVARTSDSGRNWEPGGGPTFAGAIFGGAYVPGAAQPTLIIVGPAGADYSVDDGRSWQSLDDRSFWGVGAASAAAAWIVGPDGRIVKVSF